MMTMRNRVALITGSTGEGMGRSIALTMGKEGAKVVLNYGTGHPNNMLAAEKVLEEIRTLGGKGYAFKADTREEDEVKRMVEGVIRLYGEIDYLICNAGGPWEMKDITEIEQEHWRSVIKAELDGFFYCVKHVLPHMRSAHSGRIIAIGLAGAMNRSGPPYDYSLGKAGRVNLMRALAADEAANGITCNVVAPGHMEHVTIKQAMDAVKHAPGWRRRTKASPQDVAEAVKFLCSEEGQFINGSVIEVRGSLD